jgi:hypothetical protein
MEEIEIGQVGVDHAMEHAHEKAHEEGHRKPWLRWLALNTAILAVLAAVASLLSGNYANEAISKMIGATLTQAKATDQWSFYQAKGVKKALAEGELERLQEADSTKPGALVKAQAHVDHYTRDQKEIQEKANGLEEQSKKLLEESDELLETHHGFAYSVTLLQVAIGLCAMAAIIERKELFFFGSAVGFCGLGLFIWAFIHRV